MGLRDLPIESIEDEALGLGDYAKSLSEFIMKCETPLTIALQGDWGSGKTSLMNMIEGELAKSNSRPQTFWFNTWQYSQFGMADELTISLISAFLEMMKAGEKAHTALKCLRGFLRFGCKVLPSVAGAVAGEVGKTAVDSLLADGDVDNAKQIKELKEAINKAAGDICQNDKLRIVIFVDDLDRLMPERAVELLETFKLFLDVPGCVFILACDYQVVSQGLKKKFGLGEHDLKGKSFFDKIIQLPFSMPVAQYDARKYIGQLLKRISIKYNENDLDQYSELVNLSLGFNPRSMKRLFNSLLLLNIVAGKKNMLPTDKNDSNQEVTTAEKQRVLFAVLCLQTAFEPFYRHLVRNIDQLPQILETARDMERLRQDEQLKAITQEFVDPSERGLHRFCHFLDLFFETIQLKCDDDNKSISKTEMATVRTLMTFSALTATESSVADKSAGISAERGANREFGHALAAHLNKAFRAELRKLRLQFRLYQQRNCSFTSVYLAFDQQKIKFGLEFIFGREDADEAFYLSADLASSQKVTRPMLQKWFIEQVQPNHVEFAESKLEDEFNYCVSLFYEETDSPEDREPWQKDFADRTETITRTLLPYFQIFLEGEKAGEQ
jgi:hypothetical protein